MLTSIERISGSLALMTRNFSTLSLWERIFRMRDSTGHAFRALWWTRATRTLLTVEPYSWLAIGPTMIRIRPRDPMNSSADHAVR